MDLAFVKMPLSRSWSKWISDIYLGITVTFVMPCLVGPDFVTTMSSGQEYRYLFFLRVSNIIFWKSAMIWCHNCSA